MQQVLQNLRTGALAVTDDRCFSTRRLGDGRVAVIEDIRTLTTVAGVQTNQTKGKRSLREGLPFDLPTGTA